MADGAAPPGEQPVCLGDKLDERWWLDDLQREHEIVAHSGATAAARAHGVKPHTVVAARHRSRATLATLTPGSKPHLLDVSAGDAWLLTALKKLGDNATVEQIADHADVPPKTVRAALERLGRDGYRVEETAESRVVLNRVPPPSKAVRRALFSGERVRFGVISDTHLGSQHCRLEELHVAYDVLQDEGITEVLHPGDLVCGYGIFPGQKNEVDLHTYEAQVQFAVENYPLRKGISTRIIGGNHDLEGDFGKAGANPVVAFCNQREDFEYLGDYSATVELEQGTRIYMIHPKGGLSYALSYRPQKLIEGFEGGTKPAVALIGHYHRRGQFEWRNVQALLCGTFEGGGNFGVRLGLGEPAVGFHIVDMTIADDGSVVRFRADWYKMFAGRVVAAVAA